MTDPLDELVVGQTYSRAEINRLLGVPEGCECQIVESGHVCPERVTAESDDDWLCICGNQPHLAGFYPYANGREVEPTTDGPWDGIHFICGQCLRVIDQRTLEVVGRCDYAFGLDGETWLPADLDERRNAPSAWGVPAPEGGWPDYELIPHLCGYSVAAAELEDLAYCYHDSCWESRADILRSVEIQHEAIAAAGEGRLMDAATLAKKAMRLVQEWATEGEEDD